MDSFGNKSLGFILGAFAGLLLDSYVWVSAGGPLIWFLIPTLGLPFILPPAVGAWAGVRLARRGWIPNLNLSQGAVGLIALIALAIGLYGPLTVKEWYLQYSYAHLVPVYSPAEPLNRYVIAIPDESLGSRVVVSYATESDIKDVRAFYQQELTRRGWQEVHFSAEWTQAYGGPAFAKDSFFGGYSLWLQFDGVEQGKTHFRIIYLPHI